MEDNKSFKHQNNLVSSNDAVSFYKIIIFELYLTKVSFFK